jgi:hypothetical protein
MKKCIECTSTVESDAKFCPTCGGEQPMVSSTQNTGTAYSASIGDKNVISGNIIGKNEEYKISGPTTINKIEDQTKTFITCAVSGKHLLRGRDSIINCPKCKSDVSEEFYDFHAFRCVNCEKESFGLYSARFEDVFEDGVIDKNERIQLDMLAESLSINEDTKKLLELRVREKVANQRSSDADSESNDLSGFQRIEITKAKSLLFEQSDFVKAYGILEKLYGSCSHNDEISYLYFLVKALHRSNTYFQKNEAALVVEMDDFWWNFWSFKACLQVGKADEGLLRLANGKLRYSGKREFFSISETMVYLNLYAQSNDNAYFQEAVKISREVSFIQSLPIDTLCLVIQRVVDGVKTTKGLSAEGLFYWSRVLGFSVTEPSIQGYPNQHGHGSASMNKPLAGLSAMLDSTLRSNFMTDFNKSLENFSAPQFEKPQTSLPVERKYFILISGVSKGPLSQAELINHIVTGELTADTYVWSNDMADWQLASVVEEISRLLH